MKIFYIVVVTFLSLANLIGQIPTADSIFFFRSDGSQDWWYVQKDMHSFRALGGAAVTLADVNSSIVTAVEHSPASKRQIVTLKFDQSSTMTQRNQEILNLYNTFGYEHEAPVVTKDFVSRNDHTVDEFAKTNDIIIVNFISQNVTQTQLSDFMTRNDLTLLHEPSSLLPAGNWSYTFLIEDVFETTFQAAAYIKSNESGFVGSCYPDMMLSRASGDELIAPTPDQYVITEEIEVDLIYISEDVRAINFSKNANGYQLKVCDALGRLVISDSIDSTILTLEVDISALIKGVYFLTLLDSEDKVVKSLKFIR